MMNKFDQILIGQIPINEIGASLKFATDRAYRIDKFLKVSKYELHYADTNYQFEATYQLLLQAIYANGFDELHPYLEQVKNQVLSTRLPSQNSISPQKVTKTPKTKDKITITNTGISKSHVNSKNLFKYVIIPIVVSVIAGLIVLYFNFHPEYFQFKSSPTEIKSMATDTIKVNTLKQAKGVKIDTSHTPQKNGLK